MSGPPSLLGIYTRAILGAVTKSNKRIPESLTTVEGIASEWFSFSIDEAHVEQFKQVVGGASNPGVPISYLQCYLNAMPMNMLTARNFPLNVLGSVHESSSIESHKNVSLVSKLTATSNMNSAVLLSNKKDWLFKHVTTVTDDEADGEVVMTLTNEFRVLNPERNKVKVEGGKPASVSYDAESGWSKVGAWDYPVDTGRSYAGLNGDINPIHLFPITAKLFGYKSCISHGMYSVCKLMAEGEGVASAVQSSGGKMKISARFTRPTFLPAEVEAWKNGSGEFVFGVRDKEGVLKETVKGLITM